MKNKKTIIIIIICIIMISIIAVTYAYFSRNVEGEAQGFEVSTFNDNIEITFNDTSNVTLINAYTGDETEKTFTITNTGNAITYYNIELKNVVNSFEEKDDLVYSLSGTNDSAIVNETIMPSEDTAIAKNVRIGINEEHIYTMKIKFKQTEYDQTPNMNKTFSSSINVVASNINSGQEIYNQGELGYEIINDVIGGEDDLLSSASPASGVYYTNSSIDGSKLYFYTGNVNNNNVVFAGKCWLILRTTENMGIRLLYNGEYDNVACSNTNISSSVYNTRDNFNAYIGYMYGIASSNNYINEHTPSSSSAIKIELDNWYNDNLSSYAEKLDNDAIYCNNRKTSRFKIQNVSYGLLGYGNNNTGYTMMEKYLNNYSNISYNCENINDRFSVSNNVSNKALTKPIALPTFEEVAYSMLGNKTNSFMLTTNGYWLMTPAYYNGVTAYNFVVLNKNINYKSVKTAYGVRPVITLKNDTKFESGNGLIESPYKIN